MSEHGYGWWQASDGMSYPPEQHPEHRPDDPSSYGWWQASDGKSYPPSQHPEHRSAAATPLVAQRPSGYEPPATTIMAQPGFVPDAPSAMDRAGFTPPPPNPMDQAGFMPPPGATDNPGFTFTPGLIGMLVASALIVIGSVLPWASFDLGAFSDNVNGLDGDGAITLVLGLMTAGLGLASRGWNKGFAIGAIVAASLCALIAIIDVLDVSSTFDGFGPDIGISVGYGLWLVLIASIGAIAAGIAIIVNRPK